MSLEKLYFETRDENMDFEKNIDYLKGFYSNFWKKIHKNITMQYYKNALYFIKGSSFIDSKHIMYGHEYLNKKLYTGKCSLLFPKERNQLGYEVNSDQFCKFLIRTIDLVDKSFINAPKINKDLIVYRISTREDINNLKIGDRFLENNFSSTSLSPSFPLNFYDPDKKYNNYFEILIPKNNYGIYYNIDYTPNKEIEVNEYEFLLPRETTYQILKKKIFKFKNKKFVKYSLILITSEFEKYKIKKINQDINKIISRKKNNIKINYFDKIFLSSSCQKLFEIIKVLENLVIIHLKNNNNDFKNSKQKFITYQSLKISKKLEIGHRFKLNKNTKTVRDITSLFYIRGIDGFYGNPYYNSDKKPKTIFKFINHKNTSYKRIIKKNSIYNLNLGIILYKKNNYKVTKIENILDRYFNQIQLITLENI
jgi:hypothetical protein